MALELFSSFRIPYEQYVDLELIFALRLHIGPEEMGRMFFYDIMLLYHRYEKYIQEENEQQERQQAEYEQQNEDMHSEMASMRSDMGKMVGNIVMPTMPSMPTSF